MHTLELVIDLPFLASEINDAHKQITVHARGMLLEAKRAGDALLAAKAKVKHGEFKAWVEGHCRCSYEVAAKYMRVSRFSKNGNLSTFDGGMVAFLEAHAKPRVIPTTARPSFTEKDAERLLNMQARVERGEEAEKVVAAAKVAAVAKEHGMAPEALVERAEALCPDRGKSSTQIEVEEIREQLDKLAPDVEAFKAREAIITTLMDHSKEELVELLADALMRLAGN